MRLMRNIAIDAALLCLAFFSLSFAMQYSNIYSKANFFPAAQYIQSFQQLVHPSSETVTEMVSDEQVNTTVALVKPAVVSIYGTEVTKGPNPFTVLSKVDAGTGFLIGSDGYILTNKHVVASEDASYSVQLSNGKRKSAEVVYRDLANDLAVLKISGSNYPVLDLADSSKLKVGQAVIGLGNAYGKHPNTISTGAVSGLHKKVLAINQSSDMGNQELKDVIQTNAQLYPGDSGGPLFDMNGSVVGVNVAIAAGKDNVSFSIPINDAKAIIEAVEQGVIN